MSEGSLVSRAISGRRRSDFLPRRVLSCLPLLGGSGGRIAAYRPDIKLLLCLRPPVEMIYSWYWYNRNAVVASLPESFEEMMENPFLRDLGCFARHLRPCLDRFPAKNILVVQFDAIRRDPDRVRRGRLRIS